MQNNELIHILHEEAKKLSGINSFMAPILEKFFLNQATYQDVLTEILSRSLTSDFISYQLGKQLVQNAILNEKNLLLYSEKDLKSITNRDPSNPSLLMALLSLKGFHAIQLHRVAHYYWIIGQSSTAQLIQNSVSRKLGVDIHPACQMGSGIMFDHATGIVIGETCIIDDDVSIMQSVTLGGTGKETGDRHPKIGKGVMIGSGARVLGNVKVGEGAKIGAGSVVLTDVPAHTTVVGVPAKVIGKPKNLKPSETMDQNVLNDQD